MRTQIRTAILALTLALLAATPVLAAPTTLRNNGIGPLKLGMARADAVATGWLSNRGLGCELASPRAITYELNGSSAPAAITGFAEFNGGKLTNLTLTKGVRTKSGVVPGTTTIRQAVSLFRKAGYSASSRYDTTFQATFVTAKRNGRQLFSGVGSKTRLDSVSIPFTPVCE